MRCFATLVFVCILTACASSPDALVFSTIPQRSAWIVARDGSAVGRALFTEAPAGVLIRLEFSERAMAPGWHGVHVHQIGQCSDFAQGFQASGSHVGHAGTLQHGLLNPAGPEAGDLPNLFAPTSGPFGAELFAPRLTLAAVPIGDRLPLLDADGAALVVHEAPDDQTSQPIGGAGARIACAALTPLP